MSTPALPGLDLAPTASEPTGFSLTRPRAPRRQANPYEHLASPAPRGIRAVWCRDCRAPIVRGTDADICAGVIQADVIALGPLAEMIATVDGLATYTLRIPFGQCARLYRRDGAQIHRFPAEGPRRQWHQYDVLSEHVCGKSIPETLTIPSRLAYTPPKRTDRNELPPF